MGKPAKQYRAFGEGKSLMEWSKDPRCRISYAYLVQLMRKGLDLETLLAGPQRMRDERSRMLTAFGETKMAHEWAEDPRCSVSLAAICQRLNRGMKHEEAITAGISYIVLQEAFGEAKTISDWARDPRCVVIRSTLSKRLNSGEHLEEAMTRPSRQSGEKVARFWS